jgi:hypothetical protein
VRVTKFLPPVAMAIAALPLPSIWPLHLLACSPVSTGAALSARPRRSPPCMPCGHVTLACWGRPPGKIRLLRPWRMAPDGAEVQSPIDSRHEPLTDQVTSTPPGGYVAAGLRV